MFNLKILAVNWRALLCKLHTHPTFQRLYLTAVPIDYNIVKKLPIISVLDK